MHGTEKLFDGWIDSLNGKRRRNRAAAMPDELNEKFVENGEKLESFIIKSVDRFDSPLLGSSEAAWTVSRAESVLQNGSIAAAEPDIATLGEKKVPESIRNLFGENEALTELATVNVISEGKEWRITDGFRSFVVKLQANDADPPVNSLNVFVASKTYLVQAEAGKLDVYDRTLDGVDNDNDGKIDELDEFGIDGLDDRSKQRLVGKLMSPDKAPDEYSPAPGFLIPTVMALAMPKKLRKLSSATNEV